MNTPRVAMQETKKAFRKLVKTGDLQSAAQSLCTLKGLGPGMASGEPRRLTEIKIRGLHQNQTVIPSKQRNKLCKTKLCTYIIIICASPFLKLLYDPPLTIEKRVRLKKSQNCTVFLEHIFGKEVYQRHILNF